jgi:hypothetical protein
VKIDEIGVDGKFVLKAVGDGSDFNKKVKNAILGIEDKPVKGEATSKLIPLPYTI